MKLSIIAIGDELLIGQVVDTNSGNIARLVEPYGWSIDSVRVVHDDAESIRSAIAEAFERTNVVVTTGGLGPTKDDITKQVLRDLFGGEMILNEDVLADVHVMFARRGLEMNKLTEGQAIVPSSCRVIRNELGTAPIMWFNSDGHTLVAMPGVPHEAIGMFKSAVLPELVKAFHTDLHIGHRNLIITGISESGAAELLDEWERALPTNLHLAYLPNRGVIRLRLDGTGVDASALEAQLDDYHQQLAAFFPGKVLAAADLSPAEILIGLLRERGLTVGTAESCTGGNIAHTITLVPGCSDVYSGSVVSYANEVKIGLLGVDPEVIEAHGVVSEPVVAQMAAGACRALGVDCVIATSGIAGPGGATPHTPTGTVCIAIAYPRPAAAPTAAPTSTPTSADSNSGSTSDTASCSTSVLAPCAASPSIENPAPSGAIKGASLSPESADLREVMGIIIETKTFRFSEPRENVINRATTTALSLLSTALLSHRP